MKQEETRILNIRVEYGDAIRSISDYKKELEALREREAELKKALDEKRISQEEYDAELAISKAKTAEVKDGIRVLEKEIRNNIKAENAMEGSLKQLRAQLSNTTKQYDEMSEAMRKGEEGQKLKETINQLTKEIKGAEEETGRFYRNVGNYTQSIIAATNAQIPFVAEINKSVTAVKGLGSVIGSAGEHIKGSVSSFKEHAQAAMQATTVMGAIKSAFLAAGAGVKVFAAALVTTGIGALVVALGALVTALTRTQKGMESARKIMSSVGAAIDVILDRVAVLGEAVIDLFSGDFESAAHKAKNAFKGITDEIVTETQAAWALSDALNQLDKEEIMLSMRRASNRADIERLKMISDDVTKSIEERTAAAKKAFEMEEADMKAQQEAAEMRLANMLGYTEMNEEVQAIMRQIKDNTITFDGLLKKVGLSNSTFEDMEAFRDQYVRIQDIVTSSTTRQIEQQNKLNSLMKEAIELADRQHTAAERYEFASRALTEINGIVLEQNEELNAIGMEKLIKNCNERLETLRKEKQDEIAIEEEKAEAKIKLNIAVSDSIQAMGELGEDFKALSKVLALAQIAYSTGEAIAKMTSAEAGKGIAGIATMAAGIAQILTNIAAAKKAISGYVHGGKVTGEGTGTSDSIPAMLSNGESVITARATEMFAPLLSSINQMGGGVPIPNNGGTGSDFMAKAVREGIAAAAGEIASAIVVGNIQSPAPVVSVEEINRVQKRVHILEQLGEI